VKCSSSLWGLKEKNLLLSDLSDDLVGAKKGLLHLTSLDNLKIENCGRSREDISEIYTSLGVQPRWF
jgi:hypothetical protein